MYFEDATMKRIISVIMLSLAFGVATAADLQSAKDDGLVGEARSGYLAAVKTPASAEIKALIAEVNSKRRAEFEQAADKPAQLSNRFNFASTSWPYSARARAITTRIRTATGRKNSGYGAVTVSLNDAALRLK